MIKKIILLLVSCAIFTFAKAQTFTPGIKAGVNYSSIQGDDIEDGVKYKLGALGGLTGNLNISPLVSIQAEALYSAKGYKYSQNRQDITWKMGFIDVPILAQVNASPVFFELGPQISFLTSSKIDMEGNADDIDAKDVTQGTIISYVAGLGFKPAAPINIGLRYAGSFNNALANFNGQEIKARHSVFQLYLGFNFGK